jgi:dTMP kinase
VTGLFLAFEGGEGAGKSTQLVLAAQWLRAQGRSVVETREPGGTALGATLRTLLLDPSSEVTPRAETLLYGADRAQHVETVIRPALAAGQDVLTDRYLDSTLAYQGAGRGLGDDARVVTSWATGGLLPTMTVLLDLDPVVGLARAGRRAAPDRLEADSLAFHQAVRQGFLDLAAADPGRYLVLDATAEASAIAAQMRAALVPFLR